MRLLLIRHGQTPFNVAGALDTAFPGAALTPLGHAQAAALPAELVDEDIVGVHASKLIRTQLTATPLAEARGRQIRVQEGLEEVSAGDLELRTDQESVQTYTGCLARWMSGDLGEQMPGGPTGHDFLARYEAAIGAVAAAYGSDDTVAVFSHGAAIRVFTSHAARLEHQVATGLTLMNTGMAVLEGDPGTGWELARWASEPLGGLELEDPRAHDVTGERADEVSR